MEFVRYMIYQTKIYGFIAYDLEVLQSFWEVGVRKKFGHTKKILF